MNPPFDLTSNPTLMLTWAHCLICTGFWHSTSEITRENGRRYVNQNTPEVNKIKKIKTLSVHLHGDRFQRIMNTVFEKERLVRKLIFLFLICWKCVLLFIVMLAVQQTVPAVTGPGECAQTDCALDAGLVPGPLVHAQQEAVGDGRLAARAHFSSSSEIWTWWEHITATVTAKRPELVLIYK